MKINDIIADAIDIAEKFNLRIEEKDRTDNIISLNLVIDSDLFIQIYGNVMKEKLNLALVFKKQRLYGFDYEGGKYHCHPFNAPEEHIFIDEIKSLKDFVQESMRLLEEKEIL